jgi:hypothetical protein
MDIDGDGYKDLLVTHHLENSKYVARYYKGKDDSSDGQPFEATHRWASTGPGSSMEEHKARWGDVQIINDGSTVRKRLFAVGSEGENNNVIYWDYDPVSDTFAKNPTVLDVSMVDAAVNKSFIWCLYALYQVQSCSPGKTGLSFSSIHPLKTVTV